MLIIQNQKFIQAPFTSEEEIEDVVIENAEFIFGPSSIFFPKTLFKTADGTGTIPDGFVIDPSTKQWFIVEAELAKHNVWSHIAPQVSKQIIASIQPATKQLIIEIAIENIRNNVQSKERFDELEIAEIDIHQVLQTILDNPPIIGMPIDGVSRDLEQWATTLKNQVKLWLIKKYVEFGHPENVAYDIPEEYKPVLDTKQQSEDQTSITQYDVSVYDLIKENIISKDSKLFMTYGPRGAATKRTYESTVKEDGTIEVLGKSFSSPSYAALYVIQNAGNPNRKTINGWTSWKDSTGFYLSDLREKYLELLKGKDSQEL